VDKAKDDSIERLVLPYLARLEGYTAHKAVETVAGKVSIAPEAIIKIDANENPYGCSPRVTRALAESRSLHLYPDAGQHELRQAISGYCGASPDRIVVGNGSGDLIDVLLHLFIGLGDEVISCVPTFDMFRFRTEVCGGMLVEVPRGPDFAVDIAAVRRVVTPRTRMIILINPNNPTGTLTSLEEIKALLDIGLPVLVDEAYYEFAGETAIPLSGRYPNLMVLRTFSKWAGLAGLRAGYGIFPPRIADCLLKFKLPYNVSMAAKIAVEESLKDVPYLMERVGAIIAERERLFSALEQIPGIRPVPSRANFILCSIESGGAAALQGQLQEKGIIVRYFDKPLLRSCLRFSVGKPEHSDALIQALKERGG
jgi:histidinol-phosphate aminotransferase